MADLARCARRRAKRVNFSTTLLIVGIFCRELAIALASMELQVMFFSPTVKNMLVAPVEVGIGKPFLVGWSPAHLLFSCLK